MPVVGLDELRTPIGPLHGRDQELDALDEAWACEAVGLASVVGGPGRGKSALVRRWLEEMEADGYRGAEDVLVWSFPDHRPTGGWSASADLFIERSLKSLHEATSGPLCERGRRLAGRLREKRMLLVLFGLEHWQSELESAEGRIKHPALEALIGELSRDNRGLCALTAERRIPGLESSGTARLEIRLKPVAGQAGPASPRAAAVADSEEAAADSSPGSARPTTLGARVRWSEWVRERCRAGDYANALVTYAMRLEHGADDFEGGTIGVDLETLSAFFDPPWAEVAKPIAEDRSWTVVLTALLLRAAFVLERIDRADEAEPLLAAPRRLLGDWYPELEEHMRDHLGAARSPARATQEDDSVETH